MSSSMVMRGFADSLEAALAVRVSLDWYGPFRVERDGWDAHPVFQQTCALYMFVDSHRVIVRGEGSRWIHREILRVGKTYDQTLAKRISQYRGSDEWDAIAEAASHEVTVKVARVELDDRRRMSRQLLHDVENLLLVECAPIANAVGTTSYDGRPLSIENERKFLPLRPTIRSVGRRRR